MTKRYQIKEAAKADLAETHGHLWVGCILAVVDQCRAYRVFAPVGADGPIMAEAKPLFDDEVEEIR